MHIKTLDYFQKIVTTKSISKVATMEHISQSALSQLIQKMEDDFGCKLLIRSNRGVKLTPFGEIVFKYSQNMVRMYENMKSDLNLAKENEDVVRVSANWPLATYALPCVLYDIKQKFKNHTYHLSSNFHNDKIIEDVENNIVDFGFVYGKPESTKVEYIPIGKDKATLLACPDFAIDDTINLEDVFTYEMIDFDMAENIMDHLDEKLRLHNKSVKDFKILFKVDNIEGAKVSIKNGYGIAFLPYSTVKTEVYKKTLKEIEIRDFKVHYDIYLVYKKNNIHTHSVKDTLKYLLNMDQKDFC
ncbi:LysR family transcriptional regulator [Anaeromicrobium sediminis]|uniref:HTH lysR-type domain-containing protein n=1 Tax=Anaeromicrobium sediminis TaxID=1478221 RepID=A0A267MMC3_9FIRM|nr:LysR family transcriptional regulator [Anaeromicrobium sediminis]PAB60025.1 hypothetical protein CCE28_06520 [Anaeromicrobium sediminis]